MKKWLLISLFVVFLQIQGGDLDVSWDPMTTEIEGGKIIDAMGRPIVLDFYRIEFEKAGDPYYTRMEFKTNGSETQIKIPVSSFNPGNYLITVGGIANSGTPLAWQFRWDVYRVNGVWTPVFIGGGADLIPPSFPKGFIIN